MTDWIGALFTWIGGAVLISSGLLKLGTTDTFQVTLSQFGLPRWTWQDSRFARAFPWCEISLGVAAALLPAPVHLLASVAILLLFVAFLVLVIRVWRRPTPVSCNCFGGLGDDTVGPRTVIRNGVLVVLALAATVLHRSPASTVADHLAGWCYPLPAVLAVAIGAGLLGWRAVAARRRRARLIRTLTVRDVDGNELPITEFQDPPTFLVFFAPRCGACHALVDDFRWWPHLLKDGYDLQPAFIGTPADFAGVEKFAPLAPHAWYVSTDFARTVGITGTPGMTILDAGSPLGRDPASGYAAIQQAVLRPDWREAAAAMMPDAVAADAGATTEIEPT